MNSNLTFTYEGIDDLANCLRSGLNGYAVTESQHGRLTSIWLFMCDEVLQIQSNITTVHDWEEVGTLHFRCVTENEPLPEKILIPLSWLKISSVSLLQLEENDFRAQCGIALSNTKGSSLIMVSGALPMTVELQAEFYKNDFQPEYEIKRYSKIEMK